MEKYPFLTLTEHKILQSQQEYKALPYRQNIKKRIPKYLKNIKKCKHDQKLIYPHYCQYHMKNVVVCDLCGAERTPPTLFTKNRSIPSQITKLQKEKVAHDWFL